jgi:lysophospholipase L1-like esterase
MSAGLPYQVDAALEYDPDIAVILIGGNDVTHISGRAAARAASGRRRAPAARGGLQGGRRDLP